MKPTKQPESHQVSTRPLSSQCTMAHAGQQACSGSMHVVKTKAFVTMQQQQQLNITRTIQLRLKFATSDLPTTLVHSILYCCKFDIQMQIRAHHGLATEFATPTCTAIESLLHKFAKPTAQIPALSPSQDLGQSLPLFTTHWHTGIKLHSVIKPALLQILAQADVTASFAGSTGSL